MRKPWVHHFDPPGGLGFALFFGLLIFGVGVYAIRDAVVRSGSVHTETLSVGIMASVVGLSIFMWGVRAIRHPKKGVWVDLKLRTVIRVDGPTRRLVHFENIGELVVKSSTYRARVGNGSNNMTTLTSYAVLAPESFEDTELFVGGDAAEVEAWAETLRSMLRAPPVDTLTYDEAEMCAAESSFGASREQTVLWRAAPFAVNGHLSADTFKAAKASYVRQRGSFLGCALASRVFGAFLLLQLLGTGGWLVLALYDSPLEHRQELVITAALCLFFGVMWLRAIGLWSVAIVFALVSAAALGGKPFFDPITSRDEVEVYQLSSEVHFNYLVSGAALIASALFIAGERVRVWIASRAR